VAVQFSLSYDANGDPVLVENTVTGTRKVVSTSPVVSEYKSRFDTADPITDAEENQPDSNQSAIYDYIKEMEGGAADDINLSFIEKQNLQSYTPEAIEARSRIEEGKESMGSKVLKTMLNFIPMDSGARLIKAMARFLPEESPEIKAVKQYYADPETAALVESIPGMSNYNIVYGNPFDPSYGLSGAAQKRIDRIDKTLSNMSPEQLAKTTLIDRKEKLQELIDKENRGIDKKLGIDVNRNISSMPSGMGSIGSGGGGRDSGNQGTGSPTGTNRPGGPSRPDDVGSPGSKGPGGSDEMGSF